MEVLLHNDSADDVITRPARKRLCRRDPNVCELTLLTLAAVVVCGVFLAVLPFVIAVLGAIAPFAVVGLFLRWLWRTRR